MKPALAQITRLWGELLLFLRDSPQAIPQAARLFTIESTARAKSANSFSLHAFAAGA